MINLLATGLISLCLLSPVQSPDCAGDIGVSTPIVSAHVSVHPKSILPIPLPPIPPIVLDPLPHPPVVSPVHLPEPPPIHPVHPPHPPTGPNPAPPVVLAPPVASVPESAAPAPVVPTTTVPQSQAPAPVHVAPTLEHLAESTPKPSTPVPAAQTIPRHYRPPFTDGSFGAVIGNAAAQFPDLLGIFTILVGLGIIALVERLDESPKLQSIFRKKQ